MDLFITEKTDELKTVLAGSLRKKERVMLCFPETGDEMGSALAAMVEECAGVSVFWGNDFRWKTLLRKAFSERCGAVIGSPEIILGLGKLAKRQGVPLYINKAILIGPVPDAWMIESICSMLDCQVIACCCVPRETCLDEAIEKLCSELRRWTTILDFRLEKMGAGLSLEMITFPGEKLPRLPSFARLVVRDWNPDRDCPFDIPIRWKNISDSRQNH